MRSGRQFADFDSSPAMLRALSRSLRGRGFPFLGLSPLSPPLALFNLLPGPVRERVQRLGGRREALAPSRLGEVDAERACRWAAASYPRRRYPAAALGSSNGALTHLWAALGVPWLPQTFLVAARRRLDADRPDLDFAWGRAQGAALLKANPDVVLHQMHDPNQDRLMVREMSYFRLKRRALGEAYRSFLEERLEPGATLFVADCRLRWPTARSGERHLFQLGGLGGLSPGEYPRRWPHPPVDGESPEAEWGFEPALLGELEDLARRRGWRLRRLAFDHPEDPSPLVCDLYRRRLRRLGLPDARLVASSFVLMDPWWTLRLGAAPFWLAFNAEPSAAALERYLDGSEPFDDIRLMLFSNGTDAAGQAPIARWRGLLARARRTGEFLGVDEDAYPRDFGSFTRYHTELRRLRPIYPAPEPLTLAELDEFLSESAGRYRVAVE